MKREVFEIKVNGRFKKVLFVWNCEEEDWEGVINELFNTVNYEYLGNERSWKGGVDFSIEYFI